MKCPICGFETKGVGWIIRCDCENDDYIKKIEQLKKIPKEIIKRVKEWFADAWVLGEREPYLQKLDKSLEWLV